MNELLLYLLKSILAGMVFLGCYQIAIRKETYLAFSRYYLLSAAVLMVILPLMGTLVPWTVFSSASEAPLPVIMLPEVVIRSTPILNPQAEEMMLNWVAIGYGSVTLAMLGGLLLSLFRIIRFYRSAMKAGKLEGNIYVLPQAGSPFSFAGKVFITDKYVNHPGLNSILIHEKAHIRQKHMLDLILLELLSSIFWFNPFFFLIKRSLREVHEFLADRAVIEQGTEPVNYQQLLYNEVSGNPQYIIANNFNLLIKKRIVMLIKKSGKKAALRIGLMMPFLIAAAIMISGFQGQSRANTLFQGPSGLQPQSVPSDPASISQSKPTPQKPEKAATAKPVNKEAAKKQPTQVKYTAPVVKGKPVENTGDDVFTVVEEMPQYPGGQEAMVKYMMESIKYPEAAREKKITGTVFVTFVVEEDGKVTHVKVLRGVGGGCDEEAVRVVSAMPNWLPGKQKGKVVRVQYNLPIKFALN